MRKTRERNEAIRMRREDGKSVKTIARVLGVSSGSVSKWVRGVVLTDEQKVALDLRGNSGSSHLVASLANQKKSKDRRKEWQEEGSRLYEQNGKDFAVGCAIYWAEGSKRRNALSFCNTDANMMVFFVSFVRKFFEVSDDEISIAITCYLNNGLTIGQIQNYWLDMLGLPEACLRKATMKSKYYDGIESGKHPYGVCRIDIGRTDVAQKIFGAISKAAGIDGNRWLG
jgi:transposase-like protein